MTHVEWSRHAGVAAAFASLLLAMTLPGCLGAHGDVKARREDLRKQSESQRPTDPFRGVSDATTKPESSEPPPVTVMFVNGEAIHAEDILRPVRDQLARQAETMPAQQYRRYVIDLLGTRIRTEAHDRLLYQEASKRLKEEEGKKLDEFVDTRVREIVNKEHQGRQTRYEKALARKGSSLEKDRERIRREMIVQRYLYQTVGRRVQEPTRHELWQYFEQHKNDLSKPPRRELFLIEIPKNAPLAAVTTQGSQEVPLSASTLAGLARSELANGADFGDVACRYSTGVHAAEGGAWGFIARDAMRERWQPAVDALFAMESGQVSDLIEATDAYFIVRCGQIDAGLEPDFAAMQPELIRRYREQQFNGMVEELVTELRGKATIEPRELSRFLRGVVEAAPAPAGP